MKNGIVIKYYFLLSSDLGLPTLIYCYNNWYVGYAPQFYIASIIVLFDARHMVMILILSDYDFHPLHYFSQYLVFQSLSSTIAHIIVQIADIRVCQTLTSIKKSITIFHRRPQFISFNHKSCSSTPLQVHKKRNCQFLRWQDWSCYLE